jgi:hypothetical protein
MAVWALARLFDAERFATLRRDRMDGETDPNVRAEWTATPAARRLAS